jgi:hypothetical protein
MVVMAQLDLRVNKESQDHKDLQAKEVLVMVTLPEYKDLQDQKDPQELQVLTEAMVSKEFKANPE